ncbi:hypothetical protein VNO78_22634 [Psophocarpus tetragonolobus]|uniref:Uncharacterized protein n=1 Tax=Psophocarpus tetragonolobus TaxID=3891 RepID=A0AAN9XDP9_PSOTE
MGTQVLQPQDCLVRAPPAHFSRRRSSANYCNYYYYNNHLPASTSRSCRKPATRPDQRKRVVPASGQPVVAVAEAAPALVRRSPSDDSRLPRTNAFEKVTILRRGQSLDSAVKTDVYAGSAFSVSPSPSALPLPSFPTKKQALPVVHDSATRDLRRLLRLE